MDLSAEIIVHPLKILRRARAAPRGRAAAVPLVLSAGLVGLLAIANYVKWIHSFFVADSWVLIGSVTQVDWSLADLSPFHFWDLPHQLNPLHYYSPTLLAITWASVKLGGYNPEPYNIMLIALHLGTTLFLFASVVQLTGSRLKATAAAGIFAVHFASTEAVGWFGANSHPIVGFFGVMSLALYVRYLTTRRPLWWIGSIAALFIGALAQASGLAWFAVLACLDIFYSRNISDARGTVRRLLLLGAVLVGVFSLQFQALFMAQSGYRYRIGPWILFNLFYYPLSTVIPSMEENAISLARDALLAPFHWAAYTRVMGMREAFHIVLSAGLMIIVTVLLWTKGGWIGRFAIVGFAVSIAPFLMIDGQGYRYLYTPLMFFCLAMAHSIGELYAYLRSSSRLAAIAVAAIIPIFVVVSFAESQRQLFWWHQAGLVAHNSLHQLKSLEPSFPRGAKVIFGGLPDTLQHTNAEVWRQGITEAVRAVYADRTLRVEAYGKEAVEQLFKGELRDAPDTYGFVWEDWQFKQIAP